MDALLHAISFLTACGCDGIGWGPEAVCVVGVRREYSVRSRNGSWQQAAYRIHLPYIGGRAAPSHRQQQQQPRRFNISSSSSIIIISRPVSSASWHQPVDRSWKQSPPPP